MSERAFKTLRYLWLDLHIRVSLALQCRMLRARRGWTRRHLAERAGLRIGTIYRVEFGLFMGHLSTLTKIASAFDVGFVARFGAWSEVVSVPDDFTTELKDLESKPVA